MVKTFLERFRIMLLRNLSEFFYDLSQKARDKFLELEKLKDVGMREGSRGQPLIEPEAFMERRSKVVDELYEVENSDGTPPPTRHPVKLHNILK